MGISEDRLHHILGVARKAYKIALERGHDEAFAKKMFLLGWLHDVKCEFCEKSENHGIDSSSLIVELFDVSSEIQNILRKDSSIRAIRECGRYTEHLTEEYIILNMADMQVDYDGREVDVMVRLDSIKERYGEYSDTYLTSCDICYRIGLTAVNIAANIL